MTSPSHLSLIVEMLLLAIALYLVAGIPVGAVLALRGVNRLDDAAAAGSLLFRLIALPGLVALWPVMLLKWLRPDASVVRDRLIARDADAAARSHGAVDA